MGTDNDRIHVCVRLKKDEEDYLCGIASVRISDGITICGIRIYSVSYTHLTLPTT